MTDGTEYTQLAQRFNEQISMKGSSDGFTDESDAQFDVCTEEFEEFMEAYIKGDIEGVAEEMADVLITMFIQADRMGIDIGGAYQEKMAYNLEKTGERDEDGKVVDDASTLKPDFSQFVTGVEENGPP